MKQIAVRKKHLILITSVLAILGLTVSIFAETAGGAHLNNSNKDKQHVSADFKSAGAGFGHVDIQTTGSSATATAAAYVEPEPETGTASDPPAATNNNPTDTTGGVTSGQPVSNPPATPPTEPPYPCAKCPVKEGGTMIACPDYCVQPTPNPGCQPCGYRELQTRSNMVMCPEMLCAY